MTKLLKGVFFHPYIYSGLAIARITVCTATILWAAVVLIEKSAFKISPSHILLGSNLLGESGENLVGLLFGLLGLYELFMTVAGKPPSIYVDVASFSMVFLWTVIMLGLWLYVSPLPPAHAATTTTIMLLSWWNLIALPKRLT